jgi:hypothetical protein
MLKVVILYFTGKNNRNNELYIYNIPISCIFLIRIRSHNKIVNNGDYVLLNNIPDRQHSSISFWRVLISVHSPFWRVFEKYGFPHCTCKIIHQYLLESNYSCLWKHVENNLFLSNFMKISSPSLNIFYNLFYFRGLKHNSAEGWKYWKRNVSKFCNNGVV